MELPLVKIIFTTLILISQLPKSGCEGGSGVFTRVPSMIARSDFTSRGVKVQKPMNTRGDSDYPVYRVVSRTRQEPMISDNKEEKRVTQVMGGEPYTGGLEHRLAHVKKFGSFAGKTIIIYSTMYRYT